VLAVIVDGEPVDDDGGCFPLPLRRAIEADGAVSERRIEVVAADLRAGQGGRRLALLKLVSGMLGVGLDQLIQRDAQRRQAQLAAVAAASLAGVVVLGGLSLAALAQRDAARRERAQAEALVEFMVGDLRTRLEPAGRLDVMDQVAMRALAYYSAQENRGLDAQSLGRRARVLHLLGEIRDRRGDTRAAQPFFEEAARSTSELLARRPDDPALIFDHAQSVFWVGYLASRRGHNEEARRNYLEYRRLAERLTAINPRNLAWQAEVGYANGALGTVLLDEGRVDEAAQAFQRQLGVLHMLARDEPANLARQLELGAGYAWLADADVTRGRYADAMQERTAERDIYRRLESSAPRDATVASALAVSSTQIAMVHLMEGSLPDAQREAESAVAVFDRLIAASPDDTSLQSKVATSLQFLAHVRLLAGNRVAATQAAERGLAIAERLSRSDASIAEWRGTLLGNGRLVSIRIAATGARTPAEQRAALQPIIAEADRLSALSAARPDYLSLARMASESDLLAGDAWLLAGDRVRARTAWRRAFSRLSRPAFAGLPRTDRVQMIRRQARQRMASPAAAAVRSYAW
jgi:tetratricopeptide (TPR) repeat protein